jgi:O-antigen/teichoic acid export membrane protein
VPLTVLLTGVYQSFNYWSNRKKNYRRLALSRVVQSGTTASTNLGMGFNGFGSGGLILSSILGQGIATTVLGRLVWRDDKKIFKNIKSLKIISLAKKYVKFPKFDIPSSIIYTVYSNMAIIFFTNFFESSVSGFYFFANRILKTPFSFFISAFSDVFYQKLSRTKEHLEISKEVNQFSLKLLKITLIPFLIVVYSSYFYVEPIFGEKWEMLYLYIDIFALPIYIGLILAPYGHVLKIINRQEISMYLHLFRLTILGLFLISYLYIDYSLEWFLYLYAVIDTFIHLFLAFSVDIVIKNIDIKFINFVRLFLFLLIGFINFMIIL